MDVLTPKHLVFEHVPSGFGLFLGSYVVSCRLQLCCLVNVLDGSALLQKQILGLGGQHALGLALGLSCSYRLLIELIDRDFCL